MPADQANPTGERGVTETEQQGPSHDGPLPVFVVRLEQYDGPLDALLDLVKKQSLDVRDLPIAQVTEQYLESVRRAESLDMELGSEFLLMAAKLIQIKSKALLPIPPAVEEQEAVEAEVDLVQRLVEREKFLLAARMLREKRVIEEHVWTIGRREEQEASESDDDEPLDVSLFDLVRTFGDVLERLRNDPTVEMSPETVSVANRVRYLQSLLQNADGPVPIRRILLNQRTARAVVATFLALLEMVKGQIIKLTQQETFGEILIQRHALFDESLDSGSLLPGSDSDLEYSH